MRKKRGHSGGRACLENGLGTAVLGILALLVSFLLLPSASQAGRPERVMVILSSSHPSYLECSRGVSEYLEGAPVPVVLDQVLLQELHSDGRRRMSRGCSLVISIGSEAADFAAKRFSRAPVVFSMVLDPPKWLISRENVYGICLDIPAWRYAAWFRELIAGFNTLGVLYTRASVGKVEQMRRQLEGTGVALEAVRVDDLSQLPNLLDQLASRAQALLAIPDEVLYNNVIAPRIIYLTVRRRLPFAGLSVNFTRAGALFSLDVDYRRLGHKTGRLAAALLEGRTPEERIQFPDSVVPHLNLRTAKLIGLKLDERLIAKFEIIVQ